MIRIHKKNQPKNERQDRNASPNGLFCLKKINTKTEMLLKQQMCI